MKHLLIICLFYLSLQLLSCSVTNELTRSAEKGILNKEAFTPAFTGISVYEPATGKYWYNHFDEKYFVPASNTKFLSCYAAMKYLGDSIEGIRYRIENDSTVVIRATGDPTFLHPDFKHQPVLNFLKKFNNIQIEQPTFTRHLGNGWSWNDYMQGYMAQRSAMPIYGNVVQFKIKEKGLLDIYPPWFLKVSERSGDLANGFSVTKPWDYNEFIFSSGGNRVMEIPFVPDNNTLLQLLRDTLHANISFIKNAGLTENVLYSQPLDSMLKNMMHRSDNFYAEQCLLMVSQQMFGFMDEKKVIDTLKKSDFSSFPQAPKWADGSGLSRYNNFSPRDFITLLIKMKGEFGMNRIETILPTGGTGTISSYYLADKGNIFVKTGTLNGVVALSGYLTTKKNRQLIFSVLVNHHNSPASDIRKGIEEFVQYLRNNY